MFTSIKAFLLKGVAIPGLLVFSAFVLSQIYFLNLDTNPNILSQNDIPKNFIQTKDYLRGEIHADENYLGILKVTFERQAQTKQNSIFRIKELSDKNWRHTSTINSDHFYYTPSYRFGFPTMQDSKNKTYVFEIFLERGVGIPNTNTLTMSREAPYVTLQYDYKKSLLLSEPQLIGVFIKGKILFYMRSEGFWNIFAVYSIPLLFYIFFLFNLHGLTSPNIRSRFSKNLAHMSKPYLAMLLGIIAIDIFIFHIYSDLLVTISVILWILGIRTYGLKPKTSFYVGIALLLLCSLTVFSQMDPVAEKLAIFAYVFLVLGTTHAVLEVLTPSQDIGIYKSSNLLLGHLMAFPILFDRYSTSLLNTVKNNIDNAFSSMVRTIYIRRPTSSVGWTIAIIKTIILLIILSILMFFGIKKLIEHNRKMEIENHIRQRILKNPQIDSIEPSLVYKATNIVIYGREFGWNVEGHERLFVDGKPAVTDLWTDTEIVFAVPLDWRLGVHKVWIEKPISWEDQNITAKSRAVTFTILPITNGFTKEDRVYFEQLKFLKKTTLELNGYN